MELWLRFKTAQSLEYDRKINVSSEEEWRSLVYNPNLISSVLWPTGEIFPFKDSHFKRRHKHEKNYFHDPNRNKFYWEACNLLAQKLNKEIKARKCLLYAPLRGAFPIWKVISQFMRGFSVDVYYPVTSSFVFYPPEFKIRNHKSKNPSGRFNNILELQRLKPFLSEYGCFIYLDEIVSGGMMNGYLNDMIRLQINKEIPIIAVGLADGYGQRSILKRKQIELKVKNGFIYRFLWQGCAELITEDNKFLLGIHYIDYSSGLNVIPVLNHNLKFYSEKLQFDSEVLM